MSPEVCQELHQERQRRGLSLNDEVPLDAKNYSINFTAAIPVNCTQMDIANEHNCIHQYLIAK
jgi:hypothetical protein